MAHAAQVSQTIVPRPLIPPQSPWSTTSNTLSLDRTTLNKPLPPIQDSRPRPSTSNGRYVNARQPRPASSGPRQESADESTSGKMSLFNLFGRPKVEKLRGYAEPGLPPLPTIDPTWGTNSSRHNAKAAKTETAPRHRSPSPYLERAHTPPLPHQPTSGRSTPLPGMPPHLPPLQSVYSQAVKVGLAHTSGADTGHTLRFQPNRKASSPGLNNESPDAHMADESRRSSRLHSHAAGHGHGPLPRKIFALTTKGSLLQYSERGAGDRSPERCLTLTKESVVIASDLVPGQPYTLQVAQAMDAHGVHIAQSNSLFSKFLKGQTGKRSPNMLIILNDAKELEQWMHVLRKEVQMLGGHMDFSKAVEMRRRHEIVSATIAPETARAATSQSRRSSTDARSTDGKSMRSHRSSARRSRMDPVLHHCDRSPVSSRTDVHQSASPIERKSITESTEQSPVDSPMAKHGFESQTAGTIAPTKRRLSSASQSTTQSTEASLARKHSSLSPSRHSEIRDEAQNSHNRSIGSAVEDDRSSERGPKPASQQTRIDTEQPGSPESSPLDARPLGLFPNGLSGVQKKNEPYGMLQPKYSQARVYHVPSQGAVRKVGSLGNVRSTLPPTIHENAVSSSTPENTQASVSDSRPSPPPRKLLALPIKTNGKILHRSSSQSVLPTTHASQAFVGRRHSSNQLHAAETSDRSTDVKPGMEHSNASQNNAGGNAEATATKTSLGPTHELPFKVRGAIHQPPKLALQTAAVPAPRPGCKLSLFPAASSPVSPSMAAHCFQPMTFTRPQTPQDKSLPPRPVSLQGEPEPTKYRSLPHLASNSFASHSANNAVKSNAAKPALRSSKSFADFRSPMSALPEAATEPLSSEHTRTFSEESTRSLSLTQSNTEPTNSPIVELGATVNGPLTLPRLDFGMPLVGLAPPAPPPQAPLPQVPPTGRMTPHVAER